MIQKGKPSKKGKALQSETKTKEKITLDKESVLKNLRLTLKCKSENQKQFVNSINDNEFTIIFGPAGSGKTLLACNEALSLLKNNPSYEGVLLVKSVTGLESEDIGFIKGSVSDKMSGILYSFIGNFEKLIGKANTQILQDLDVIKAIPISFFRGLSFSNHIICIDEAQNISINNMRTIMTRVGSNCKVIIMGDTNQIDMKNKKDSSLKFLIDNFKSIEEISFIEFSENDIFRNPLIKKIEKVFNDLDSKK
jgi:phosphate starvation-inducible PhoH-like protein